MLGHECTHMQNLAVSDRRCSGIYSRGLVNLKNELDLTKWKSYLLDQNYSTWHFLQLLIPLAGFRSISGLLFY